MRDTDLEWKWTIGCVAFMAGAFFTGCAVIVGG